MNPAAAAEFPPMPARPKLAAQQLGEGPDVILVHGLAANRAFWFSNLAMALQEQYRVTLYDLRGHGYSERPAQGYTVRDQAGDLIALMDKLDIAQASVIGHSFGGSIALEAAVSAPDRFRHLGLLDTRVQRIQPELRLHDVAPLSAFEIDTARRVGGDWENDTDVGLRFLEAAARLKVASPDSAVRDDYTPFGEGRGARKAAKQWLSLIDDTALAADFRVPGVAEAEYKNLSLPCLLLYAEHSRAWKSARRLKADLPQAELVTVPDAGHFFPITHPQLVAQQVSALLARHPTADQDAACTVSMT